MSKYKAILFDLDGTLLPMDIKTFTMGYFGDLSKTLASYNIPTETLIKVIWAGVDAMVANDGTRKNVEAFWEKFYELLPDMDRSVEAACAHFYGHEFSAAKRFTMDNPYAVSIVQEAKNKAEKVVLASNPLFPMDGHAMRLSFVGLSPEDFDLVTSYESDCFCKPNSRYYDTICDRLGVKPEECLMIGNDEEEDMYAASQAGLDCYLVTDTCIPSKEHPWEGAKGSMADLYEMLKQL